MNKKLKELRQKKIEELKVLSSQKRKELVALKLKKVKDVHQGKSMRKEMAKILTIIRERELVGGY